MADFRPSDTKCYVYDTAVEETGNELSEKCVADEKMGANARQSTPRHTNQVPAAHDATRDSLHNFPVCEAARKQDALQLANNTLWKDLEPTHHLHSPICRSLSAWLLPDY